MAPNKTTINFNGNPSTRMWNVPSWSLGTTEVGSSGSPMFNQDGRIVGVLSGGAAACSGTINNGQYDVYGRFGIAWEESASISAQLKHWLDPNNTGATIINGFDPGAPIYEVDAALISVGKLNNVVCSKTVQPEVVLLNNGTNPLTSVRITFTINGAQGQYDWTGTLETGATAVITLTSLTISEGENVFTATVTNPNNTTDENPSNDSRTVNFLGAARGERLTMELNFDCYAEETSWRIIDQDNTVWYFGENYENQGNTSQSITENSCLTEGCYTLIIEDDYGDGMKGSVYSQCNYDGSMRLTRDYNDEEIARIDATNVEFDDEISFDFCVDNITNLKSYDLSTLIRLYPNPANNQVTLVYDGDLNQASYQLYSITGNLVAKGEINQVNTSIAIHDYKRGIYLVRVENSTGSSVKKLVVR
jgi:hypothetical protein